MKGKKDIAFAVKSRYFSVYQAFKTEMERIGYVWNDQFNEFTRERFERNNCVYVSSRWMTMPGKIAMSFYYTAGYPGPSVFDIDLDSYFGHALAYANSEFERYNTKKTVKLPGTYLAEVYSDKIVVGCQTIPADTVRKLFETAMETGLITK